MPKSRAMKEVSRSTATKYEAAVKRHGQLSPEAERITRVVRGQGPADRIAEAREKIRRVPLLKRGY